jgi:hypothetical protein
MSATTWNGVTVPTASDVWALIADMTKGFNTANLVIPVANQTARDGLAALAPGGVLPVGTVVIRNDLAGEPFEKWDGSVWNRSGTQTWIFNRGAGSDSTFTSANTGLVSGTITSAPAGLYRIDGQLGLYGSPSAVGRVFVSTGASPTYYKRRQDLTGTPSTYSTFTMFTHTGGNLAIAAGYDVTSGTAAVMSATSGESSVVATFIGA